MNTPITVAYGDGIGPEIMEAAIKILKEAEAPIRIETIEVGEKYIKKIIAPESPKIHGNQLGVLRFCLNHQ